MSTYIVKLGMDAGNPKYGAVFNVVYFLVPITCVVSLLAWPLLFPLSCHFIELATLITILDHPSPSRLLVSTSSI